MLEAPARAVPTPAALAAAGTGGALLALQARVNGALRVELDDVLLAALVSFLSGLAVLAVVVLPRPAARRALARVREVPSWQRLGGLGGAVLIAASALAVPEIGVALLTLGLVAGQTGGGLLVDRLGLSPGGARPVTAPRLAGAGLCLLAVGLAAPGGTRDGDGPVLAAVVVAGLLLSVQAALNGRVQVVTRDPGATGLLNFAVGSAALLLALAVSVGVGGLPDPDWPASPWLYTGGVIGAGFVAMAALVVRVLGVLRMSLAVIAGQVVGALLLDLLAPVPGARVAVLTLVGAALTLVAVAVAGRGSR